MVGAFVLIHTEPAREEEALKKLKTLDAVEKAYIVYGVYDIIAKIKAENEKELQEIVSYQIRRIDAINSTTTAIITQS